MEQAHARFHRRHRLDQLTRSVRRRIVHHEDVDPLRERQQAGHDPFDGIAFLVGGQDHQGASLAVRERLRWGRVGRAPRGANVMPITKARQSHGSQSPSRTYRCVAPRSGSCAEDSGIEQPRVCDDATGGVDEGGDPRDGGVDHPSAVLHGTHLTHLKVLRRCGRRPYDALLTVTMRNVAPAPNELAGQRGKLFSKQMGVPKVGRSSATTVCTRSPGVRSTGICCEGRDPRQVPRHGMYSPKGTRCTLS